MRLRSKAGEALLPLNDNIDRIRPQVRRQMNHHNVAPLPAVPADADPSVAVGADPAVAVGAAPAVAADAAPVVAAPVVAADAAPVVAAPAVAVGAAPAVDANAAPVVAAPAVAADAAPVVAAPAVAVGAAPAVAAPAVDANAAPVVAAPAVDANAAPVVAAPAVAADAVPVADHEIKGRFGIGKFGKLVLIISFALACVACFLVVKYTNVGEMSFKPLTSQVMDGIDFLTMSREEAVSLTADKVPNPPVPSSKQADAQVMDGIDFLTMSREEAVSLTADKVPNPPVPSSKQGDAQVMDGIDFLTMSREEAVSLTADKVPNPPVPSFKQKPDAKSKEVRAPDIAPHPSVAKVTGPTAPKTKPIKTELPIMTGHESSGSVPVPVPSAPDVLLPASANRKPVELNRWTWKKRAVTYAVIGTSFMLHLYYILSDDVRDNLKAVWRSLWAFLKVATCSLWCFLKVATCTLWNFIKVASRRRHAGIDLFRPGHHITVTFFDDLFTQAELKHPSIASMPLAVSKLMQHYRMIPGWFDCIIYPEIKEQLMQLLSLKGFKDQEIETAIGQQMLKFYFTCNDSGRPLSMEQFIDLLQTTDVSEFTAHLMGSSKRMLRELARTRPDDFADALDAARVQAEERAAG